VQSAGITVDTTSTSTTIVGGSVTNTGNGDEWAVIFGTFRTSTLADRSGSITAASSGLTLRTSSNNSGAGSSPWDITGTLDSAAAVTAAGHAYTLGVSGVGAAAGHKMACNVYINPAAAAATVRPPKPVFVNQAIARAANW
jgi:hypothetical protein